MKKFDPATNIEGTAKLGPYNGVNPPINDSATFAFEDGHEMLSCFEGEKEAFLYSRHWQPTNMALSKALAAMEGTEAAWVTGSGMAAITNVFMQVCKSGDHIIATQTSYGGTYAFLKNYFPKFNVETTFVDITDLEAVKAAIRPNTKMIYTETMTNPMLQISDIPGLKKVAQSQENIQLVVDNTFTPMIFSPIQLGADIVVYSMTKFVNGKNDTTAGAICASQEFINSLICLHEGSSMLLGGVLDSMRASSIHKNLYTLHLRMKQHSSNAAYMAKKFVEYGIPTCYPGLEDHEGHSIMKAQMNEEFGFGGMIAIDLETPERASQLMKLMQEEGVGYLAVSLGYFRTLFSNSGKSTSSEIPEDEQKTMGLSPGLVRYSVGLDNDIETTFKKIIKCIEIVNK